MVVRCFPGIRVESQLLYGSARVTTSRFVRVIFYLPLLGLPALGHFLVPYLEGRGFISRQLDILDDASFLLLPFAISSLFAVLAPPSVPKRIALFFVTLVLQFALLIKLVPGAAESEMIGLAQRLNRQFSAAELRSCAADLLQREQDGTLTFTNLPDSLMWHEARVVDDPPLPPDLRGKFQDVRINQPGADLGSEVIFEIKPDFGEPEYGVFYTTNEIENDFWHRKMADGVYAYRFMRP